MDTCCVPQLTWVVPVYSLSYLLNIAWHQVRSPLRLSISLVSLIEGGGADMPLRASGAAYDAVARESGMNSVANREHRARNGISALERDRPQKLKLIVISRTSGELITLTDVSGWHSCPSREISQPISCAYSWTKCIVLSSIFAWHTCLTNLLY